jgi:hypothetical protein
MWAQPFMEPLHWPLALSASGENVLNLRVRVRNYENFFLVVWRGGNM